MLTALEGYVKNGQAVINENIAPYEGQDFVIIFLKAKRPAPVTERGEIDLDKYTRRTEWGQHVEEYMDEMRDEEVRECSIEEKRAAYERLQKMTRPIPNLNYDKELEEYSEERYQKWLQS